MRTEQYNPSQLEVEFSYGLTELTEQLGKYLPHNKIVKVENRISEDNPMLVFHLVDSDNDKHELVIKVIQRPDIF
jgi:hypothetical protein